MLEAMLWKEALALVLEGTADMLVLSAVFTVVSLS